VTDEHEDDLGPDFEGVGEDAFPGHDDGFVEEDSFHPAPIDAGSRGNTLKKIMMIAGFVVFAGVMAFFTFSGGSKRSPQQQVASTSPIVSRPQVNNQGVPQMTPQQPAYSPTQAPQNAPFNQQPYGYQAQAITTPPVYQGQSAMQPMAQPMPMVMPTQPAVASQAPVQQPTQYAPETYGQPQGYAAASNQGEGVPMAQGYPPQPSTAQNQPLAAASEEQDQARLEDIESRLMAKLEDIEKKQSCESDNESAAPVVSETEAKTLADLKATQTWLVDDNKSLREKNSSLRKDEKSHRYEIDNLKKKISELESKIETTKQAEAPKESKTKTVAKKSSGPGLPKGWHIQGMAPMLVALDNPDKQESVLLKEGDEVDGVTIIGIDFEGKQIVTSRGVVKWGGGSS